MMKTIVAALSLLLMLTAAPASAQTGGGDKITPELVAALEKEPPLSQADIDTFIRIMTELSHVAGRDPAEVIEIFNQAGLAENRFSLIYSKMIFGMLMVTGVSRETLMAWPDMSEVLMPGEDEMKLIEANLEALGQAFDSGR